MKSNLQCMILFVFMLCIFMSLLYVCNRRVSGGVKEQFNATKKEPIWIYWEQGWENAPYLCKKCLESWIKYNSDDYDVIQLDANNLVQYIHVDVLAVIDRLKHNKSITSSSDLLRINLLALHGGFWVDATMMCTSPIRLYKHKLRNTYDFWCPFDVDGKIHSYNYLYCTRNNTIVKKIAKNMNRHFEVMRSEEMKQLSYLYLGYLMYDELERCIDWNVIKEGQLSPSSNNKKLGYKLVANSKSLLLQPITEKLKSEINKQYFLKLTANHGIKYYNKFEEGSVIAYLIQTFCST